MYSAPEVFPFSELLSDDTFDIRLEGQSFLSEHTNCGPPIPPPLLQSDEFAGLKNAMLCGQESWVQDISGKLPTNNKPTTGKIKISNNFPAPQTIISPSQSPSITPEKKIIEKEKHKERQRQRRQKMTDTMSRLKSMIPECVKREEEASLEGKKKQKVDQNQLLEMTVDYIQVLKNRISQLEHENNVLRTYVETNNSDLSSDILSDLSSSPDSSPQSSNDEPIYFNSLLDNHTPLIGKRNLSNLYQGEMEIAKSAKQPRLVRAARVLMAVFVVGLIYYNPVSFPTVHSSSPSVGSRVLQSTSALSYLGQAPEYLSNLIVFVLSSVVAKIIMVMFWTFAAMLLDHIYVPSSELVKLARQENDIGVKKYDKGDYQGSRRHFEKAMIYLGRSPRASIFTRIFHIPLELWRQVLHLLRFGLWCDGFLVHLHGGQEAWLETARCNHYLFSLNVLANNLDSQSVLYFLVSLNTAESLFQKPPVLAEVYATIAIAFYGLLRMPKVYQYMMGKAWNVVENFPEEEDKRNDSAVDNTKAYLLFLSSYGSLCDGDLQQVQAQIQRGCDLFLKKGNKNMFFQGQFVISYTHFLRGNYFTTMQIMKNIEVCNLGDPRISWWREVLIIGCKLCLYDSVSERDLCHLENLYSKVESHSTFAPTLAVLQQSILALLLLRLDYKDRAIEVAMDALTNFEDSTFTGYIFYCSYYIAEVFFTIWEEEKQNTALTNQLSRLTHRLCTCLRRVAKVCELGKPIALLVIGRYTLNMKEYSRAIDYLKKAVEASEHCSIESYKVQATWLISRAEHELTAKEFSV